LDDEGRGVGGGSSAVLKGDGHVGSRGKVDGPGVRNSRLGRETLQSSGRGLSSRDDGEVVRGRSSRPCERGRLALNDAGRGVDGERGGEGDERREDGELEHFDERSGLSRLKGVL